MDEDGPSECTVCWGDDEEEDFPEPREPVELAVFRDEELLTRISKCLSAREELRFLMSDPALIDKGKVRRYDTLTAFVRILMRAREERLRKRRRVRQ